jgi:hypothetical protein
MGAGYRVVLAGALALLLFVTLGLGVMIGATLSAHQPTLPTRIEQRALECDHPKESRASEVCAQWKAADAAADSAQWAARSAWISGLSGLFVLVALGFAFEANRIARDSAKRQLRAYVEMQPVKITPLERAKVATITATFINTGQTPARNLRFVISWKTGPLQEDEKQLTPELTGRHSRGQLGSHQTRTITRELSGVTEARKKEIAAGKATIWVYGLIIYEDIFGHEWETPFRFLYRPAYLKERLINAQAGNEAT